MSDKVQIYVAGSWESKSRLAVQAEKINQTSDFQVNAEWLVHRDPVGQKEGEGVNVEHALAMAEMDMNGVMDCDIFILDTFENTGRGGKDFEHGYAVAIGKEVWLVGPYINIFQRTTDRHFDDWEGVHRALAEEGQYWVA